ncbi:Elongation factor [Hirschfeldia incana]|nr:Elongation factor [Hirschfeldia incana]
MELNQQSQQLNADQILGRGHEECVLSTNANTSEGTLTSVSVGEELDVDIVEPDENNIAATTTDEEEDPDATEYSSSFSDTASEDADMLCDGLNGEAEVESHYWDETDLGPAYDSFSSIFHYRKKRLTSHWKSFIRPLMWRSKWVELKIRELESRALEYPKELESLDQEKLGANIDPSLLETCGNGIKSLPFSNPSYRKGAVKRRRKRKKVESTDDIASYMSQHNLFSYIENKRLSSDGMSVADDFAVNDTRIDSKDRVVDLNEDDSLINHREGDNVLEEVLWKIELAHSQVHRLKTQVDLVMSKNAARFSSSENLSLLAASSAPSPTVSAGGDVISIGPVYSSSHLMQDYGLGDFLFSSEGVGSSYGDAFHIPDIIESTVGLFADADVTFHHPRVGDSCENILDNILIRNGVAEEMNADLMETSSHEGGEKPEEGEGTSVLPLQQLQETEQDSVLRSCLATERLVVPRNKRTRGGERKASSWCKKHISDPESQ